MNKTILTVLIFCFAFVFANDGGYGYIENHNRLVLVANSGQISSYSLPDSIEYQSAGLSANKIIVSGEKKRIGRGVVIVSEIISVMDFDGNSQIIIQGSLEEFQQVLFDGQCIYYVTYEGYIQNKIIARDIGTQLSITIASGLINGITANPTMSMISFVNFGDVFIADLYKGDIINVTRNFSPRGFLVDPNSYYYNEGNSMYWSVWLSAEELIYSASDTSLFLYNVANEEKERIGLINRPLQLIRMSDTLLIAYYAELIPDQIDNFTGYNAIIQSFSLDTKEFKNVITMNDTRIQQALPYKDNQVILRILQETGHKIIVYNAEMDSTFDLVSTSASISCLFVW
jgi:hypothetical protein